MAVKSFQEYDSKDMNKSQLKNNLRSNSGIVTNKLQDYIYMAVGKHLKRASVNQYPKTV